MKNQIKKQFKVTGFGQEGIVEACYQEQAKLEFGRMLREKFGLDYPLTFLARCLTTEQVVKKKQGRKNKYFGGEE